MPETKDSVGLYSLQTLIENYRGHVMHSVSRKVPLGKSMISIYKKLVEDINDIYLIEIIKVSPRKWQVVIINTSDDSYNVEDNELFLSPANFNLKVLSDQVEIYQYNSFFGIHTKWVSKWELERFPEKFKIYDENDKEITQEELEVMCEEGCVTL